MSIRKTIIDQTLVEEFLCKHFTKEVTAVTPLIGGELSCPFSFVVDNREYIIRIDKNFESYQKDAYAWKHFHSSHLPVPEMIESGKFDRNNFFAITKKLPGNTLDTFSDIQIQKIIPSMITVLDTIHDADITQTKGYGYWDVDGNATFSSWKEYITTVDRHNNEWLRNPTNEYVPLLKKIHIKILDLSQYCPEERYLVHGDFGFNNVLSNEEEITAVLDWGESRYGDFAYDIAWLDAWQSAISYEEIFRDHYNKTHKEIPYFSERIGLYKLFIFYGSIIFFIQSEQQGEAKKLVKEIEELLI